MIDTVKVSPQKFKTLKIKQA